MNHAKILDCTLRDGAYLVDKKFGENVINGIINGLVEANIDYIEIGFLQDNGAGEGRTVFTNEKEAERFIPIERKNSSFTVLADYSRYSIENLGDYTGKSFDAVRACFFKTERYGVIDFCREIKKRGYKLFVQPVDILGYTDMELIELINSINEIEPYCFSIVDTFGSMYSEDLQRVYNLVTHNLINSCRIGLHSHNNLQMSSALAQAFLQITYGQRNAIIDTTLSGMGRGAGNAPTELVAQYMISKFRYSYNLDAILDLIDIYIEKIRSNCSWGYSTPYFITGCYSAHVNNIAYLMQKNSIRSKDIRYILNQVGGEARKRYDYDLLEKEYLEYLDSDIDDRESMKELRAVFGDKDVLLVAPGSSVVREKDKILNYVDRLSPIVIAINFIPDSFKMNYIYVSNAKRFDYWRDNQNFRASHKIVTSNLVTENMPGCLIVSFLRLIKCGWAHIDNSAIMLLRLLDQLEVKSIGIAGLDGYEYRTEGCINYVSEDLSLANSYDDPKDLNKEISEMLEDYLSTRMHQIPLKFVTCSRFDKNE